MLTALAQQLLRARQREPERLDGRGVGRQGAAAGVDWNAFMRTLTEEQADHLEREANIIMRGEYHYQSAEDDEGEEQHIDNSNYTDIGLDDDFWIIVL